MRNIARNVVAHALLRAASRLISTRGPERRHECRRGTHECVRHVICLFLLLSAPRAPAYPLDGAASTGIRRLVGYKLMKLPAGALLRSDQILLRLKGVNFDIASGTPQDPYLKGGLERIFSGRDPSYAVAVLDISDPQKPRYASLRGDDKK